MIKRLLASNRAPDEQVKMIDESIQAKFVLIWCRSMDTDSRVTTELLQFSTRAVGFN